MNMGNTKDLWESCFVLQIQEISMALLEEWTSSQNNYRTIELQEEPDASWTLDSPLNLLEGTLTENIRSYDKEISCCSFFVDILGFSALTKGLIMGC